MQRTVTYGKGEDEGEGEGESEGESNGEADLKFADAYAATAQAAEYAKAFDEDGQRLVAAGDYAGSLRFFGESLDSANSTHPLPLATTPPSHIHTSSSQLNPTPAADSVMASRVDPTEPLYRDHLVAIQTVLRG